ncbi:MAG TPA: RiPP maturation radical SAM C-methyltransferase [Burkholderiales bacterium]|nr:RiPP maturation radical SAM C-methyltransferase [Burkholderiales bacterium]
MRKPRILLVSMPWASNQRPSLALGVLAAIAKREGYHCDTLYPTFDFARRLGGQVYEHLAENARFFGISEHVFSTALFGASDLSSNEFLSAFGDVATNPFMRLRDDVVPPFVQDVADRIVHSAPDIVGFSCTFNQVFASLAVAKKVKEAAPATCVLMGGACVHGTMGEAYARAFPQWIDHVFTGEADDAFPLFLERWSRGDGSAVAGVTYAGRASMRATLPVHCFMKPCIPDFDGWFLQRQTLGAADLGEVAIPFESSRGCWWGQKSHCTFCGLNNEGMDYRTKSTEMVLQELLAQSKRHNCLSFMAADNILDHRAFSAYLPDLRRLGLDLRLFYEIKANIKRDKAAALAAAGVRWIQPGIESFSDHVLQLMRKGVTALQNIQLLRLAAEFGMTVSYNILVGFPGETDEDYRQMDVLLPNLMHLTPPSGASTIVQVHRFSPFFNDPGGHGVEGIRPCAYYRHLLPTDVGAPDDFAYFFERDVSPDAPVWRCQPRLDESLLRWRGAAGMNRKLARLGPGFIEISTTVDGRDTTRALSRVESAVLLLSDDVTAVGTIVQRLDNALSCTRQQSADHAVARLLESGLIVRVGDRVVSVVPYDRPRTAAELESWLHRYVEAPVGDSAVRPPRIDSPRRSGATALQ